MARGGRARREPLRVFRVSGKRQRARSRRRSVVPRLEGAAGVVETTTARNEDGTLDIVQRAPSRVSPPCPQLELLYWREVERVTLGLMRFSRGAIRLLGLWPPMLRFGPAESCRREIVGGLFARRPYGSIEWRAPGDEVLVAVRGFRPWLGGPFLRAEQWFHGLVGQRFLANDTRSEL